MMTSAVECVEYMISQTEIGAFVLETKESLSKEFLFEGCRGTLYDDSLAADTCRCRLPFPNSCRL